MNRKCLSIGRDWVTIPRSKPSQRARIIQNNFNGVFQAIMTISFHCRASVNTPLHVSSFAFNLPYATVDGNIFRVLSRLTSKDIPIDTTVGKGFREIAQQLLDKSSRIT